MKDFASRGFARHMCGVFNSPSNPGKYKPHRLPPKVRLLTTGWCPFESECLYFAKRSTALAPTFCLRRRVP